MVELKHTIMETTMSNLNENETKVFDACLEVAIDSDNGNEFAFDDLMNRLDGMTEQQVKGYLSQLTQKGYISKLDGCYYDFEVNK